jgi:hypothetical protein
MIVGKAMIVNYNHNHSFIVLSTVFMIVNYGCKTFIVQANIGLFPPRKASLMGLAAFEIQKMPMFERIN